MVVVLVTGTQALKDLNGLGNARLMHLDRLETTFESRILLDVLAVLVSGGSANGLQLATGQHGLQHVGSAKSTVCRASAHNGVDLIDEQHDVTAGLNLLEHLLQAFLEIATVTRTSHHGAQIQRIDLLALQRLRNVAGVDLLRQAFDHGGFADTRLADQHRIVLGAAAQHHHHTLDLTRAANHRIKLAGSSFGGQIAAKLVKNRGTGLVAAILYATGVGQITLAVALAITGIATDQVDGGAAQFAKIDIHLDQHLSAYAFAFMNQTEQDMLGADIAVPQLQRLTQRQLQHLPGMRGEGNVAVRRGIPLADHLFDLFAGVIQGHTL